jgi:small subunit ribosomal protein S5
MNNNQENNPEINPDVVAPIVDATTSASSAPVEAKTTPATNNQEAREVRPERPQRPQREYPPRPTGDRPQRPTTSGRFGDRPQRPSFGGSANSKFQKPGDRKGGMRNDRRGGFEEKDPFTTEIITVKRVTRVVKGGKRMRFAALVVVGDGKGSIGFANKKGMDFQDAVAKATKKAKETLIKITVNEHGSLPFATNTKFKASRILLKPAPAGTSIIAGGFARPVLQLAGIKNIYSKILGSNNKVTGIQAVFKALENYSTTKIKLPKSSNPIDTVEENSIIKNQTLK